MVTSWFARLALIFAVLAVFLFDGISVVVAHFSASGDAQTAAQAAATSYQHTRLPGPAVAAAAATLPTGESIVPGSVHFAANGTVKLEVRKTAHSLLLHLLSQTKGWAVVTESGSAAAAS